MADHATAIYFHTIDFLLGTLKIDYDSFYFSNLAIFVLQKRTKKMCLVGEAMVNTLQNTKYSIDEKVNQSFIQLFLRINRYKFKNKRS
jgi:hypothetical protein